MNTLHFNPLSMNQLDDPKDVTTEPWLWDGIIAPGNITLLTSQWKGGKTTLLAGLLRALADGSSFLGRACRPAKAVVISEETPRQWKLRQRAIPIGPHTKLVSRPFPGRPTPELWDELVTHAECLRADGQLDFFVVDPLATFLPGRSESDPGTLLDMLTPLRRLTEAGAAVAILHHPRKAAAEEGSTARGSGALLGYVDVILELHRAGKLACDANRRKLFCLSRHEETPSSFCFEWVRGTPEFRLVPDLANLRFRENWSLLRGLLARRPNTCHKDLLAAWSLDQPVPSVSQLYHWLEWSVQEGLTTREGKGTRNDPHRYSLSKESRAALEKEDPELAAKTREPRELTPYELLSRMPLPTR